MWGGRAMVGTWHLFGEPLVDICRFFFLDLSFSPVSLLVPKTWVLSRAQQGRGLGSLQIAVLILSLCPPLAEPPTSLPVSCRPNGPCEAVMFP